MNTFCAVNFGNLNPQPLPGVRYNNINPDLPPVESDKWIGDIVSAQTDVRRKFARPMGLAIKFGKSLGHRLPDAFSSPFGKGRHSRRPRLG